MELTAYLVGEPIDLVPAPAFRPWLEAHPHAKKCLPLTMANQSGWLLLNPVAFSARWDGGDSVSSVTLREEGSPAGNMVSAGVACSHFGCGVLTFTVPFLFRSTPGWNLLLRGPANWPKDGIAPLESLVETDWAVATATMNWRFTRVGRVSFDAGEPFGMIVPCKRGDLERWSPERRAIAECPTLEAEHAIWAMSRRDFNERLRTGDAEGWQKHYTQGRSPGMAEAPRGHQTKRELKEFA